MFGVFNKTRTSQYCHSLGEGREKLCAGYVVAMKPNENRAVKKLKSMI